MKNIYFVFLSLLMIATIFWVAGCSKDSATSPVTSVNTTQSLRSVTTTVGTGTSLSLDSIAIDCYNSYKWKLMKTMDPTPNVICNTECKDIQVTVTAAKGLMTVIEGKIFLRNTGSEATENLIMTVTLWKSYNGGEFTVVTEGWPVRTLVSKPILGAGESFGYYFEVNMENFGGIDPNCLYKVTANVSITNYIDHLGEAFAMIKESEAIPGCSPSNDCIIVTDVPGKITPANPNVPTIGWNVTVSPANLEFCEGGTYQFMLHVCNNGVPTEETFVAENSITVQPQDAVNPSSQLKATYNLSTIGCTPNSGCTRTIGFYKTHAVAGLYGNNPDMVSSYLPIYLGTVGGLKTRVVTVNTQVVSIMQFVGPGGASNGILKLYAQLLAAKLNIAGANGSGQGTSNSCIRLTIAAADAFLATHNGDNWATMSKIERALVLGAMTILDKYNNGLLCVSHCD